MLPSQRYTTLSLKADPAQQSILPQLDALAQAMAQTPTRTTRKGVAVWQWVEGPPKGLYLHGPVGRGKSMLMQLLFDGIPMAEKRRVHFHPFMEELHHRMHHTKPQNGVDLMLQVASDISAEARLLCFDEFYVTNIADAMMLGRLLEALFACGVVLCATSNWAPDNLFQDGHNRGHFMPFIGLVQKNVQVIDLAEGTDWRRSGKGALNTVDAKAHFKALGGKATKAATLTLNGYEVVAHSYSNKIGWFDFGELCGNTLGRGEYMDLCRQVKGVVVSDIPTLNEGSADAAMRFVVLVDLLYENRIPTRITAQQPLEETCTHGPVAFAFARTLSRLHELGA